MSAECFGYGSKVPALQPPACMTKFKDSCTEKYNDCIYQVLQQTAVAYYKHR